MNTKKKILFLVTQSEFGGAQRFIFTFTTSLSGYDIIVGAGPEGNNEKGLLVALEKKGINTRHLKYLKRSINPLFDLLGFFEIKKLLKIERPDILFLCSSKAGFLGSLAGKSIKIKKIIYRIGGWTFNDPWPKWKKKMYILIEKYTAKFKDFIVNNAESDRQQAIKLGIKPKKEIITIHNGLDINKLEFLPREEARKELKIENSKFVVGTIANFYPPKGLEYFIEAVSLINNKEIKFILIGDGEDRPKLEELIKKYNLKDNLILTGSLLDARKYLKAFDVFVLPSVKEGFPWVVIEAMAAEVPVVVTKVGALPEIIQNGENGILIEPRNPKAIVEAINLLLGNKDLIRKISKEGRKTVIEKFNLDKMIQQYEDLFSIN